MANVDYFPILYPLSLTPFPGTPYLVPGIPYTLPRINYTSLISLPYLSDHVLPAPYPVSRITSSLRAPPLFSLPAYSHTPCPLRAVIWVPS